VRGGQPVHRCLFHGGSAYSSIGRLRHGTGRGVARHLGTRHVRFLLPDDVHRPCRPLLVVGKLWWPRSRASGRAHGWTRRHARCSAWRVPAAVSGTTWPASTPLPCPPYPPQTRVGGRGSEAVLLRAYSERWTRAPMQWSALARYYPPKHIVFLLAGSDCPQAGRIMAYVCRLPWAEQSHNQG